MRTLTNSLAAGALFVTIGCTAGIDSGAFVSRSVDFNRYRTYNWAATPRPQDDPRLQANASFKDHFEGEVEKQLAAKGLEGPQTRRPDLLVRYRAAVTQRTEVTGVESGYGYCSFDCVEHTAEYEKATFIIDVVDARTQKIVWRGWASDDLEGILKDEDRMERRVREAVAQMMAKLPAKL